MNTWLLLMLIFLAIIGSVWLRMKRYRQLETNVVTKTSPLSLAVQELIAIAGGLYLSLITLTSFLRIDIPERVVIFNLPVDPLACASIGLAVIQPLVLKIFKSKLGG
jgi:hypothetical protein